MNISKSDLSEKEISLNLANARFENAQKHIEQIINNIKLQIYGQENVINLCLCAIFSGSHALLIGMPGLAKTSLINAIAKSLGQDFGRIQFTPDLMPSDILGAEILQTNKDGEREFRFIKGPIFTQILMADEINRASPKTQSALLEAMQEQSVTIAGIKHELPHPFHVLATQNPIEHEGAYPLPEAQLDRFLLQIDVPYPDDKTERKILEMTTGPKITLPNSPLETNSLIEIQNLVRELPITEKFLETTLKLVRELRPETSNFANVKKYLEWGAGPRAGQSIIMAAKARALIRGSLSPSLDDLNYVAASALRHRVAFNWHAKSDNIKIENLIIEILDKI